MRARHIAAMLFLMGCLQPKLECDQSLDSDEVAMRGVLNSGESLTEQEMFLGFGRFASFEIEEDCDFTAFSQTTELAGWERVYVGSSSQTELEAIINPLLSQARWNRLTPGTQAVGSSSMALELQGQWGFTCTQCSEDELDRTFMDSANGLVALGESADDVMVDVMAEATTEPHQGVIPWPFDEVAEPSTWAADHVSLSERDSEIALRLWTAYAQERSAAWPSHSNAIYVNSGSEEYALYFREQTVP